jgi:hypothetical protein
VHKAESLPPIIPVGKLADEFDYHPKTLLRLEREGKIPPFLRRAKHCRPFATEEHRKALAGRLGLRAA